MSEAQAIPEAGGVRAVVLQVDRDAACEFFRDPACPVSVKMVLGYDPSPLHAILARHREASTAELVEALERLAALTPARANAGDAHDLYLTVRAIAETALANARKGSNERHLAPHPLIMYGDRDDHQS